ncbi:hypothetical protein BJX70DRAFT_251484 [Aspergillus crustosus]
MSAKTHRLRKSISTRFVRSSHSSSPTPEPFDPELARVFATAAASRAMSRSLYRPSEPYDGSYDQLGGPRRMAVPPRRYKRSTYTTGHSSTTDDHTVRHSASSSVGSSENDQSWSAALPSISEFGGLEDRIASLPSSYRRLRRSRSMFSTRQRSSHRPYNSTSHEAYSPNIGIRGAAPDQPRLYRTLRRSMSFLRHDDRPQNTLRHPKSQDISIQLARSQYEQSQFNSPESSNWAPLPMSKVRRDQKPFRKTFRSTSTSEESPNTASLEYVGTFHSHGRARAFSSTIKKGIKRVLGLSRNVSEQSVAQDSPSSSHWGQSPATEVSNEVGYSDGRGSVNIANPHERLGASRATTVRRMQSSGSLATSRSRVTSWADSTAANTIGTPSIGGQRLSIISEQGDLGQADIHPPSAPTQHGPGNSIDSQRLFSALMKRIGGAHMQAPEEDIVVGQVKEHRAVPTQGSLRFQRSRQTIRQVPSETTVSSPKSFATARAGPMTPYEQAHSRAVEVRSVVPLTEGYEYDDNNTRKENLRPESVSSSVYSRSTNGHSSRPKSTTESPDSAAEPGVATIYSSERTAYSSPGKASGTSNADRSAQTGTDWHNWMDSQIARIEDTTPTGYHYREDAQIHDDYDTEFTSSVPARRIRVASRGMAQAEHEHDELGRKASTNSNFSRPFSRSSSLRTVVKLRNSSPNVPTPSIPILPADDVFRGSPGQDHFLTTHADQSTGLCPMLSRSSNQPRMAESPTPKRPTADVSPKLVRGQYGQYSAKWSPEAQDARTLHRRSARVLRETRRATNENTRLEQGEYDQAYSLQSPMSSQRMVEIFLNSRRQQKEMGVSDNGTPEPAFL